MVKTKLTPYRQKLKAIKLAASAVTPQAVSSFAHVLKEILPG